MEQRITYSLPKAIAKYHNSIATLKWFRLSLILLHIKHDTLLNLTTINIAS